MRVNESPSWQLLNSWWVVLPLLLGFPGWAAFLYAGHRGKKRSWLIWSAIYFVLFLPVYLVPSDSWPEDAAGGFLVAYMTIGFIHAIVIRHSFLVRLQLLEECGPLTGAELDDEIARRILQMREDRVQRMLRENERREAALWDQDLKLASSQSRTTGARHGEAGGGELAD